MKKLHISNHSLQRRRTLKQQQSICISIWKQCLPDYNVLDWGNCIPSVASKHGHETKKKHVLIGCQTWRVLPPNIWSLTAIKANCHAKGELFMFLVNKFCSYFLFLSFQAYFSLRNSIHASRNYSYRLKILAKNILMSKNKSSRQQPSTPNFTCLAAKHAMFAPN